jgi:hypothetical protein
MDAEVEVMDLALEWRIGVDGTIIEVQSDKAKGALVVFAIHPDVLTAHEAHVGVEDEPAAPGPPDIGHANEAVEIGDGRRLLPRTQEMNSKRPNARPDRFRRGSDWRHGMCEVWRPETSAGC